MAQAGDAPDLLRKAKAHRPDVVIVDVQMPPDRTDDGLRAAVELREARGAPSGVLVLSQFLEERYALDLVGESAEGVGYLLKDRVSDIAAFTDALRRVAAGGSALDPEVVARMVGRRRAHSPIDDLTPREREVLELMAQGKSNQGIAETLVVTVAAVEKHVTSIFSKLDLAVEPTEHRRVLAVLATLQQSLAPMAPRAGLGSRRHANARVARLCTIGIRQLTVVPRPGGCATCRAPVERRDTVGEARQAAAVCGIGAAASIVAHGYRAVVRPRPACATVACDALRMLDDVRERLADHEIAAGLDRAVQAAAHRARRAAPVSGSLPASDSTAAARPRWVRIAGWIPATSSRSATVPACDSARASSMYLARLLGVAARAAAPRAPG